jgi:hypothetical protein
MGQNAPNCPGQVEDKNCLLGNYLKKAWVNFDACWMDGNAEHSSLIRD